MPASLSRLNRDQNSTGVVRVTSTAPMERARFYCALWEQRSHPDHPPLLPLVPQTVGKRRRARGQECSQLRASNEGFLKPRVARAGERSCPLPSNHTVKYCFTCSAVNSVLFPATTTAPLAITTYFSAKRAAKWSPCSTNKMANRRCCLNPMITSSI